MTMSDGADGAIVAQRRGSMSRTAGMMNNQNLFLQATMEVTGEEMTELEAAVNSLDS
jgi:hypothetical protein